MVSDLVGIGAISPGCSHGVCFSLPRSETNSKSVVLLVLRRSLKLWSLYTDLEESMGTLESSSAVYDRMLDLRLATPQIMLNYTSLLQVRKGVLSLAQGLSSC